MITEEGVLEALRKVNDPELHRDLVSLGMVKEIKVAGGAVAVTVELTTPACPMRAQVEAETQAAVQALPGVGEVTVTLTASVRKPPPGRQPLPGVKHILAIGSGKGGVGKSKVTVNLAVALAEAGAAVGLVDGDSYGPSIPMMMGVHRDLPQKGDLQPLTRVAAAACVSASTCARIGQAGVVSSTVTATAPPATLISFTIPSDTRSRCSSGSFTFRRASRTFSSLTMFPSLPYTLPARSPLLVATFNLINNYESLYILFPLPLGRRDTGMVHKELCVFRGIALPLLRYRTFFKNCRHRTLRFARPAVNALLRVDVELVLPLVDTFHGADVHARSVFYPNAWFSNCIRHCFPPTGKRPVPP